MVEGGSGRIGDNATGRIVLRLADHRLAGLLTLATAAVAGIVAGTLTGYMRLEAWAPSTQYLCAAGPCPADSLLWPVLVTAHGLLMLFFVAIPALVGGFGTLALPRLIGARQMAFPALTAATWGLYALATLTAIAALLAPGAAEGGTRALHLGIVALHLVGVSMVLGAVNAITTFLNLRDPARRMADLPLFAWALFLTSWLVLLSMPILGAAVLALRDSPVGSAAELAGIFGHPAILMLALPAIGLVSQVIETTFARPLIGRKAMIGAMMAATGLGFFLWAQHLFDAGLAPRGLPATIAMAISLGLPALTALAVWGITLARVVRGVPPLAGVWAMAFVALMVAGVLGMAALALAGTDTSGLLHQVIGLGALFAIMAGLVALVAQAGRLTGLLRALARVQIVPMIAGAALLILSELLGGDARLTTLGALICLAGGVLAMPLVIAALRGGPGAYRPAPESRL